MGFPKAPPAVPDPSEINDLARLKPHVVPTLPDGRYLHWTDLRWRPPPNGLSSEDWWIAQKLARRAGRVELPLLRAADKTPFWFCRLDGIERATHELDCGDVLRKLVGALGDEAARWEHRIDQLIEEAISSSMLEGAQQSANESDPKPFVHPMVHAIILHFWLAYLHPFVDGNGPLARALFYWKMLRSGYDFAQYLSISGPIDRSRRAYYLAFAHSETDDGDLTYFVLHQLAVLRRAEKDSAEHLKQRTAQLRQLTAAAPGTEALNHRQQGALRYCARNPHLGVTVKGHASSHGVTYLTARKDLQRLEADGYLRRVRVGKTDKYLAKGRGVTGE